jgi:guanylate kinase
MEKKLQGLMFVVSAPSGTGKTTLCRAILGLFPQMHFSVSYTTRPPRAGEVNGKDYHFIEAENFQQMIDRGEFAEWAEIYGYRYGTSAVRLQEVLEEGQDILLDIDVQGVRQLRNKKVAGIFIFLLPPSFGQLEQRLAKRGTEGKTAMAERLKKAEAEMAEASTYDYLIVNDELMKAQEEMKAIILAEKCRRERMAWIVADILKRR